MAIRSCGKLLQIDRAAIDHCRWVMLEIRVVIIGVIHNRIGSWLVAFQFVLEIPVEAAITIPSINVVEPVEGEKPSIAVGYIVYVSPGGWREFIRNSPFSETRGFNLHLFCLVVRVFFQAYMAQ